MTRANWVPPIDSLAVDVEDVADPGDGPRMRRYLPTSGGAPDHSLLWLHGGGWVLGDLDTTDAICRSICTATGWEVVSADYRCAPLDRFPAAVDDALAAARWLLGRSEHVVVGGDSAGANLAGVVAQQLGGHPRLDGQVLVYPCTDPGLSTASAQEFTEGPFLTRGDMEWFYEQYIGADGSPDDPRINLMVGLADPELCPVPAVVMTVGHDPLRDEGIAYVHALRACGHDVAWIHAAELYHGSFSREGVLPSSSRRFHEVWAAAHELFT